MSFSVESENGNEILILASDQCVINEKLEYSNFCKIPLFISSQIFMQWSSPYRFLLYVTLSTIPMIITFLSAQNLEILA